MGVSPYLRRLRERVGHNLVLLPTGQLADATLSEFTIALLGDPVVAILGRGSPEH